MVCVIRGAGLIIVCNCSNRGVCDYKGRYEEKNYQSNSRISYFFCKRFSAGGRERGGGRSSSTLQ